LSEAAWTEIARSLKLTKRELEMTRGVFDNLTESAVAADLGISEHTAHIHLNHLFKKLRATTRVQVVLCVMHELLILTLSPAIGENPQPPAGPYIDLLSSLNNLDPRGTWRLYIVDDTGEQSGFILASWCLILNP
jgi:DNA-binding CsgD family transcriptional regulator